MACTSQGMPYTCTPKMAEVWSLRLCSMLAGSMHRVSGSMSANTGVALFQASTCGVAAKVNGVVMTSPLTCRAWQATNKASVPLLNKLR